MDYNKFEKNLIILLKLFNDRPNHLAKFLIENNSFTSDFIKIVLNSDKLSNIDNIETNDFTNFKEMNDFYTQLINQEVGKSNLEKELNDKLFELIQNEKYEDAGKLRDYMNKKNIKITI